MNCSIGSARGWTCRSSRWPAGHFAKKKNIGEIIVAKVKARAVAPACPAGLTLINPLATERPFPQASDLRRTHCQ